MKTIKIEQELFDNLLDEVVNSGKSFSDVIRGWRKETNQLSEVNGEPSKDQKLSAFLKSSQLQAERKAIRRYLAILAHVCKQNPQGFEGLLGMRGSSRKYLGASREEVANHGTSVRPEKIPGSTHWTITRLNNSQKRDILRKVLKRLGYNSAVVKEAASTIR